MEEKVAKLEEMVKSLQEKAKEQTSHLESINLSIKKLKAAKQQTLDNISTISGAVQAYNESVRLLKEEVK